MARLLLSSLFALVALSACALSEGGKVEEQIRESQERAPITADGSVETASCEQYDGNGMPDGVPTLYDCELEFSSGNRATWCAGLVQGNLAIFGEERCSAKSWAGYE